jgi:hypothetical protein
MPSSTSGFSGTEIVSRVLSYVGNSKTDFQTYVEQTLPLAEFRFCKSHTWRFLNKQNLSLSCTSGTNEYALESGTIGYYMAAEDVETIFDDTNGVVLQKVTLQDLRRMDPKVDDGSSTGRITHWAPLSDNRIVVYPKTFANVTLKVDGKITPSALSTLSNYPTIPYRYQESFIEYVIALALDREDDDRAASKKSEAMQLILEDIRADVRAQGGTELPRLRSMSEAALASGDLEQDYLNYLFS